MLPRPTRWKLVLYFTAMVALQCGVLWQARRSIPAGLPDFSIFYTAAKILAAGQGHELYDDHLQETVQHSFAQRAVERRGTILPFNHPPFEAIIFVPFAHVTYLAAYLIWAAINLALLFGLLYLLRPRFARLGQEPFWLWGLAALAFFPVFIALIQGQDSILLLFCYCMAFICLRRNAEWQAGSWLALGLFKFNLVVPFVLPLFALWRKKIVGAFTAVAALLLALGLMVTGWSGLVNYPAYVWMTEHDQKYVWNTPHGNIANLRGMVRAVFSGLQNPIPEIVLTVASAAILVAVAYTWRKKQLSLVSGPSLPYAIGLVATVLLSYHIYVHDLSVLFLAILIVVEFLRTGPAIPAWIKKSLYGCIAVLFCSPVYLVLTLRYEQLQLLAWVLLAFLLILLKPAIDASREHSAATPQPTSADK
jgi:hypothetical protein